MAAPSASAGRGGYTVRSAVLFVALLLLALAPRPAVSRAKPAARTTVNWPSFRGAGASGICEGSRAPTTWNVEEGTNVRWTTPVPGLGHSSPVIWGNRLWITSAVRSTGDAP